MKAEAQKALGFACLMTRIQALERTLDRSNSTTERMAKMSSSDVELAEVGYYGIGRAVARYVCATPQGVIFNRGIILITILNMAKRCQNSSLNSVLGAKVLKQINVTSFFNIWCLRSLDSCLIAKEKKAFGQSLYLA